MDLEQKNDRLMHFCEVSATRRKHRKNAGAGNVVNMGCFDRKKNDRWTQNTDGFATRRNHDKNACPGHVHDTS